MFLYQQCHLEVVGKTKLNSAGVEAASGWTALGRYGAWREDVRGCTNVAGSCAGA